MRIEELGNDSLTGVLADYIVNADQLSDLFSYMPSDNGWLEQRRNDLSERSFSHKEELVSLLEQTHQTLPNNQACMEQIHKLKQANATVVVTGQQAGILAGPLYTVYKAMTAIVQAKQYEQMLDVPVVPLFWIAGEDHDLDEIRFVYTTKDQAWSKKMLHDEANGQSATDKELPKGELVELINQFFKGFAETKQTRRLKETTLAFAKDAKTYSDFFLHVMHHFFKDEGLLYLDSGDESLRKIEQPFFKEIIEKMPLLQQKQVLGEENFVRKGYAKPIGTDASNAHLFYKLDNKRRRLDFEDGQFFIKDTSATFSKEELLQLVEEHPERFSNNVVTRPLMQEWLLPTVAFVAGPGELAYWATLKDVFSSFDFKLTPVLPRLSVTFIPRQVERHIYSKEEQVTDYLMGKGEALKQSWLESQHSFQIEAVADQTLAAFEKAHLPFRELAGEMSPTLHDMSIKNKAFIEDQIEFLRNRMRKEIEFRYATELTKYEEALTWLRPLNQPQERIVNPFTLLNIGGQDIFSRMLDEIHEIPTGHVLVYL
ncbi:hypothetical protein JCM19046_926 [Bacillus sp. JCM 19046]|nr:hypothetical protein JCM19045_4483 [Bacillus sp. JCM 19045]GAF16483.1 hypothetical protein JCM19046_926 [Bacillus sp. JCM 19046]